MKVSVVINASHPSASLRQTLLALRRQTYQHFEVVVVTGPCADANADILEEFAGIIRIGDCSAAHPTRIRNRGIALASGEVVAFIEADAVPVPSWLDELVAGYDSERVAGVGGPVRDPQGNAVAHVYNRFGKAYSNEPQPYWGYSLPRPDRFLSLPETNASFRRRCLEEIGGFDEELESDLGVTDACLRLLDRSYELRVRDGAVVYRRLLPNPQRTAMHAPFSIVKDRLYFALRSRLAMVSLETVLEDGHNFTDRLLQEARTQHAANEITAEELAETSDAVERAVWLGIARGQHGERKLADFPAIRPQVFQPFPTLRPHPQVLTFCFVAEQRPTEASSRTWDLARGFADQGHEVHFLTCSSEPNRIDFTEGIWVHRLYPEADGPWCTPEMLPIAKAALGHAAAVHREVRRIAQTRAIDLVSVPLTGAAGLFCLLDDNLTCVLSLTPSASEGSRPMRTLEQLALRSARYLYAPDQRVLNLVRWEFGDPSSETVVFVNAAEGLSTSSNGAQTLHAYVDIVNRRKAA